MSPSSKRLRIAPTTASAIASGEASTASGLKPHVGSLKSSTVHVRSAGTTLSAASAASPLGSSTMTAQRSRRRSSRTLATRNEVLPCSTAPGTAVFWRGTAVFWRRSSGSIVTGPWASHSSPSPTLGRAIAGAAGTRGRAPRASGAAARSIEGSCHSDGSSVDAYTPHCQLGTGLPSPRATRRS
jgi:hypothetical protein